MIVGVLIGVFVGEKMNESTFRKMMAVIILITIFIMLFFEYRKKATIPTRPEFAISMGLVSGFTTMIGNLAGAFSNLYFLALRMSKNNFIGTAAWIFLAINYFKLPFQIFYWKNITINSLKTDLLLIPSLIIGFVLGIKIVALIKDDSYRKLIILMTFIGAIFIFIKK